MDYFVCTINFSILIIAVYSRTFASNICILQDIFIYALSDAIIIWDESLHYNHCNSTNIKVLFAAFQNLLLLTNIQPEVNTCIFNLISLYYNDLWYLHIIHIILLLYSLILCNKTSDGNLCNLAFIVYIKETTQLHWL